MGLGLFNCTLIVSYWPFQSWIWVVRLCFSLSNFMRVATCCFFRSWHVCSKLVMIHCSKFLKHINISFFCVEWLEIGTSLNLENYWFSICISSTTCWTCWDDYVMGSTCSTYMTCSIWMLSITWSRLISSFYSMLPCVAVALSSFPSPLSISFE
jgi:hypothetical protein